MYFKYLKSTKRPFCSLVFFRTVLISKEYTGIASLLRIQQVPFEQLACLFLEKRNLTCRVKWYQMPFLLVDPGISDNQRELSIIHVDVVVCCDACFDYPQYNTTWTSQGRKKSFCVDASHYFANASPIARACVRARTPADTLPLKVMCRIFVNIFTRTYVYNMHIHIQIYVYIHINLCIHVYISIYMCVYASHSCSAHIYIFICPYIYIYGYIYALIYIHIYIYMYIYIYIYIYI